MNSWEECLFLKGENDISNHFTHGRTMLIMGLGFDPRACRFAEIMTNAKQSLTVCAVNYHESSIQDDQKKQTYSEKNWERIQEVCKKNKLIRTDIPMYKRDGTKKTLIISENVRTVINQGFIEGYDNIVIDVSAMPRGVSFSIIKRLIEIRTNQRICIAICENSKYDDDINPVIVEESAEYLPGFNTFSMSLEQEESETIWFPVLGMDDDEALRIISGFLKPIEICPVVPFPSIDIRRGERMIRASGDVLFRERNVEKRNIIYIPENDPRLVYQKLFDTVKYYEKAFTIDQNRTIQYAFSSESSKLIDVGVLLAILSLNEKSIKTGIVVVENQGYKPIRDYDMTDEVLYCLCLNDNIFDW